MSTEGCQLFVWLCVAGKESTHWESTHAEMPPPPRRVPRAASGQVATANTVSRMLSSLPSIGWPIRIMIYDLPQGSVLAGRHPLIAGSSLG